MTGPQGKDCEAPPAWVQVWREAGEVMERLRREELRQLDAQRAIALLCGPADYRQPPRAPKPTSGLVRSDLNS